MLKDLGLQTPEQIEKFNKFLVEGRSQHSGCISSRICEKCSHLISDSLCLCVPVFECPNCGHQNGKNFMKITQKPAKPFLQPQSQQQQQFEDFTDYKPIQWNQWFMKMAYLAAYRSKDPSSKYGAVIIRGRNPISFGYNGICIGVDDKVKERSVRPEKYKYYEHAERNAIYNAARNGIATAGCYMYVFGVPCCDCARSIIQSGIKEVWLHKQCIDAEKILRPSDNIYVSQVETSLEMFKEAGVDIHIIDAVLGETAYIMGKKISV